MTLHFKPLHIWLTELNKSYSRSKQNVDVFSKVTQALIKELHQLSDSTKSEQKSKRTAPLPKTVVFLNDMWQGNFKKYYEEHKFLLRANVDFLGGRDLYIVPRHPVYRNQEELDPMKRK